MQFNSITLQGCGFEFRLTSMKESEEHRYFVSEHSGPPVEEFNTLTTWTSPTVFLKWTGGKG